MGYQVLLVCTVDLQTYRLDAVKGTDSGSVCSISNTSTNIALEMAQRKDITLLYVTYMLHELFLCSLPHFILPV